MIRHTILFKLKSNTTIESVDHAINSMCDLKSKLPGIIRVVAGECYFHDEKSTEFFSEGISHGISIDFVDQNALDQFFKDSVTHPAKEAVVSVAEGGYKGIIGFDFIDKYK